MKKILKELEMKDEYFEILDDIAPMSLELKDNLNKAEKILKTTKFLDFEQIKKKSRVKSNNLINAIINTYVTKSLQTNNTLIKKKNLDIILMSQLLYQAYTAEYAVTKLLEQIDEGNVQPRTFEVLPGLQRTLLEINKQIITTQNVMEIAYKNFNHDLLNLNLTPKPDLKALNETEGIDNIEDEILGII